MTTSLLVTSTLLIILLNLGCLTWILLCNKQITVTLLDAVLQCHLIFFFEKYLLVFGSVSSMHLNLLDLINVEVQGRFELHFLKTKIFTLFENL